MNCSCKADPGYSYHYSSWNTNDNIGILIFILFLLLIVICVYIRSMKITGIMIGIVLIFVIIAIMKPIYFLYVPSALLSSSINSPEFLDKTKYFKNHSIFLFSNILLKIYLLYHY